MEGFNPVLPNEERAKNTIFLFRFFMIILLLGILGELVAVVNFHQHNYITTQTQAVMVIIALVGIIRFFSYIILIIFFIMWMRRAYHNLHKAGARSLRHREGWAAGAWFVPFVNLVWPLQIMRDIWNETQNVFRRNDEFAQKHEDNISGTWWALFLISGFVTQIGAYGLNSQNFEMGYAFAALGDAGYILAAFLSVRLIRQISFMETEMYQRSQVYYAWLHQQYAQQYAQQQQPNYDQQHPNAQQSQEDLYKPKNTFPDAPQSEEDRYRPKDNFPDSPPPTDPE